MASSVSLCSKVRCQMCFENNCKDGVVQGEWRSNWEGCLHCMTRSGGSHHRHYCETLDPFSSSAHARSSVLRGAQFASGQHAISVRISKKVGDSLGLQQHAPAFASRKSYEAPQSDFSQEREPRPGGGGGNLSHEGASESHANQRLPCICRLRQPCQTRCFLRKVPAPCCCSAQRNVAPHMTLSKVGCHLLSLTIVFWRACTWLKKRKGILCQRGMWGGLPALALRERQMLPSPVNPPESSNCSSRWRFYTFTRFETRVFGAGLQIKVHLCHIFRHFVTPVLPNLR